MRDPDATDEEKAMDEEFDAAVAKAFKDEGLMVTQFAIVVEVADGDGGTHLVFHESESMSPHLRSGMLQSAQVDWPNGDEDDE